MMDRTYPSASMPSSTVARLDLDYATCASIEAKDGKGAITLSVQGALHQTDTVDLATLKLFLQNSLEVVHEAQKAQYETVRAQGVLDRDGDIWISFGDRDRYILAGAEDLGVDFDPEDVAELRGHAVTSEWTLLKIAERFGIQSVLDPVSLVSEKLGE